ncbi:MAG: beta-lactamase family protein, partial [Caldiserica bacterium]|nr:beta-lactamase family protein [Caldisericota bacterium]
HKLLKFVIVPLIFILFGTFAYWHFNSDTQWNEAGRYYLDNYQGDRTFNVTNVQDYLNKNWGSDDLKYVVSMWYGGKSYHFSKQSGSDKEEVDSESLFRVASVSKVFTSIAMLQLVEKGKIKLDDPVEKYVPYKKNFKQQPTVGDLLLHTAGFDNNNTSFFYHRRIDKPTLKDFLFRQELVQAIEPRKVVDYTNTAFDIAGYIIEQVSGQRFEDYCQENIFLPLGMKRTSFDEPESYVSGMDSKGQVVENYYVGGRPSGGLVSTSKDMSLFMECLMQGGRIGKTQIFGPKLMSAIFEKQFEMDPNLPLKKTPVFWIDDFNGMKCYAQMGKILGFSSHLIIIPGKVAVFCATADQETGQQIGWLLLNTFFGKKVDSNDLSVIFSKTNPEDSQKMQDSLDAYTGRWINMFAWNRNNVEKIANAVAFNLNLTDEDGKLFIDDVEMEKVDDLTFRSDDWYVKFDHRFPEAKRFDCSLIYQYGCGVSTIFP